MMRHQEPMILSPIIDKNPHLLGSLNEFLKIFNCPSSTNIHIINFNEFMHQAIYDILENTLLEIH